MNTIILRFRDSFENVDTILEHNKIFSKSGYVWWGWWKKVEESSNIMDLRSLKKKISSGEIVTIGIFDRTSSRFYRTILIDLVYNFSTKFFSPEQLQTPEYYNKAKLYCWFKISEICKISESEFESIFTKVPIENNTFYSLPIQKKSNIEPRVKISGNCILHLSDLHFGSDFGFPNIQSPSSKPLINIIKDYFDANPDIKIGLVIVSGDITTRADADVFFGTAKRFFTELYSFFKITKKQIIIVPGNHDIPLHKADFLNYTHEETFKVFLKEFYGKKIELSGVEKFITNNGLKLDILRINSVRLRKVTEKNFGYVGWDDYNRILQNKISDSDESIKIAVLHHHLLPVPNEEPIEYDNDYGSVSVTVDSGKVLEGLQKYNFNMVLHGHQHVPGINKVARGVKEKFQIILDKDIFLVGAGSAGVLKSRLSDYMNDNSFSIIKIEKSMIEVKAMRYNKSIDPEIIFSSTIEVVL